MIMMMYSLLSAEVVWLEEEGIMLLLKLLTESSKHCMSVRDLRWESGGLWSPGHRFIVRSPTVQPHGSLANQIVGLLSAASESGLENGLENALPSAAFASCKLHVRSVHPSFPLLRALLLVIAESSC
mmetsp:Transcript_10562/g.15818  ORF Transcript_10562/g.15818 Transcript_10562/m.15818 type:complete len:127 (-) Transcript_10562:85-465(-)